jgi:PKD repeat protein
MAFCQDTKCDTIRIFAQAPCKASFVTELDSMNQQPRVFKFASTSTGNPNQFEWRFGDDTGATGMPQVQHQYKYPGTYKVCLLVMKKSGGTTWCTDSICQTVKVPEYFNLGGHLFTGIAPINNPVSTGDTGIAYLFKYRGTGVVPFDTSFFTYLGYYAFPNLLPGDYLVKAELTPGSLHYSGFMPAYFPEVMTWSQSVQLVITDSSEYQSHISLPEVPVMVPGNGIIKGTVFMGEPGVGSLPEPHAKVLLFNDQLAPLGFSCPDYFGTFSFEGLPLGLYYLYAEKTGKYSRYSAVWLDENRPHQDSVFLGVFDYDVTGTNENSGMCPFFFQVYPNPSAGKFFVKISHPSKGTVQIRFSDMTGRMLLNTFVSQVPGETVTEIDAAKFRQGIYLVTVADEKGNLVTKKIVRL